MKYSGELLSVVVAMTWTVTALCAEVASRRMGQLQMNVLRMVASLLILALLLWLFTGSPLPAGMPAEAVIWLLRVPWAMCLVTGVYFRAIYL